MAQSNTHLLSNIIPELTDTEHQELIKALNNPVIIKYFRAIALTAVFEQAKADIVQLTQAGLSPKYLIDQAYQKGILYMAEDILSQIPKE